MKILVLSFYYSPDLSAGAFRTKALIDALREQMPAHTTIDLITTVPNRYNSFSREAPVFEEQSKLNIYRIKLPTHHSGMIDQARVFLIYAWNVLMLVNSNEYHLVYGTSSRLMTATLASFIARIKSVPLYLDIRDIFADTIKDVLPHRFARIAKPVFSFLERWTLSRADKVNLVSNGFKSYFEERYSKLDYSFFTNGIDAEFIRGEDHVQNLDKPKSVITVLYAGNMGEGQGLHAILPELSKCLENRVIFRLIGDGGRKQLLQQRLIENRCSNVEVLPPVNREQLLSEYERADVLFLHLNDYDAFRKVLPSKIFEYGALGKPILAGVSGYAAEFIEAEVENAAVFKPCDVDAAIKALEQLHLRRISRAGFVKKYSRINIMREMATDVLLQLPATHYTEQQL